MNGCEDKKLKILKDFIENQNANVYLSNADGETALSYSIKYGYFKIFEYLDFKT
jgi:ankyrin repeat protein